MLLGIDLGTGSIKVLLQELDGTLRSSASAVYPVLSPEPGAAETDPELWMSALAEAMAQLHQQVVLQCQSTLPIDAIGFSGQMHGIVPLSQNGEVIHPAILWADSRGREFLPLMERHIKGHEPEIMNAPNAGMTALSILWLKKYHPELYEKTRWFLFPKDYIRYRLTGQICTDFSDASGSLLYNFKNQSWDQDLCRLLQIDERKLPPIRKSLEVTGHTFGEALRFGLPEQVPVVAGAGDTPAALFGSACYIDTPASSGIIQISVGTAVQVVRPLTSIPEYNQALNYYESVLPGQGYQMAAMLNGGLALERVREWLRYDWDEFYQDFDKAPTDIPADLTFLPYLAGERTPYRNPNSRGAWIGLSLQHTRRDLMASALFGVACTVRLGIETLLGTKNFAYFTDFTCRLVGGSSRRLGWVTLLASVLEHPLQVAEISDASARGAAAMAGTMLSGALPKQLKVQNIQPRIIPELDKRYTKFLQCYDDLFAGTSNLS